MKHSKESTLRKVLVRAAERDIVFEVVEAALMPAD
jgi:hypothetical protein